MPKHRPYYQDPSRHDPPPSRVANYFLLGVGIVTVLLYGGLALLRLLLGGTWPWK